MNIMVHPASIPALKYHLMSSTALTPTQHKSKGLGMIIGIVASVAIPFAAPFIATQIGLSTAIGTAFASAAVGAGLGAGLAALQGGNVLLGAAGGGLSGGISGFNQTCSLFGGPAASSGAAAAGSGAAAAAPAASGQGLISATSFVPPAGVDAGLFAAQSPSAFFSGAGAPSLGFANGGTPTDFTDFGTGTTGSTAFTGQAAGTAPGSFATPGPGGVTDFGTGTGFGGFQGAQAGVVPGTIPVPAGAPAPEQGFLAGLKTKAGGFLAENKDQILRTAGNIGAKALGNVRMIRICPTKSAVCRLSWLLPARRSRLSSTVVWVWLTRPCVKPRVLTRTLRVGSFWVSSAMR